MGMFDKLIANLKASKKTIVFTEGCDARILSAADRLLKEGLMGVILCGNVNEVNDAAKAGGFNISGAEILDPATYPEMDALVAQMVELRKGKMTEDECRAALKKSNYFGTMLVKAGKADSLLGGATYSTADTVRPALQIIKTKKGSNLVSSSFILLATPTSSTRTETLFSPLQDSLLRSLLRPQELLPSLALIPR